MPKSVATEKEYEVKAGDVFLSLKVGEAQFGRHDIFLGTQKLLRVTGDVADFRLGAGDDLAGTKLLVKTLAVDVNTNTNRLTISYELTGGKGTLSFAATEKVESDFGSLLFKTSIAFSEA